MDNTRGIRSLRGWNLLYGGGSGEGSDEERLTRVNMAGELTKCLESIGRDWFEEEARGECGEGQRDGGESQCV